MKKLLIAMIAVFLFGCGKADLQYEQVEVEKTTKEVQFFVEDAEKDNGLYLYMSGSKQEQYVLLTGIQEPLSTFSDVTISVKGDELHIQFSEQQTNETTSSSQQLWKVHVPEVMDKIRVFRNGEETNIDGIY